MDELSLIAFPTRELFIEKIDEFDLIILDRYKRRGILPAIYCENVRQLCRERRRGADRRGPGVCQRRGSIYRSPLGRSCPARPPAA